MPFKIVSLMEKNKEVLSIVPDPWVYKGKLKYPKNKFYNRLSRDEHTKPESDWTVAFCSVKRSGYISYEEAERELNSMLENSDTDLGEHQRQPLRTVTNEVDFNSLAQHLVLTLPDGISTNRGVNENQVELQTLNPDVVDTTNHDIVYPMDVVQDSHQEINQHNGAPEPVQLIIGTPSNVETLLNKILENQNNMFAIQNIILENQRRNSMRIASLSVQLEETVSKYWRDSTATAGVVTLEKTRNNNDLIHIEPIKDIVMLEALEELVSNDDVSEKMIQQYSILCSSSRGSGKTCAYRVLDTLFTREFITSCSWTGGSRGRGLKHAFMKYVNVINFFFKLINRSWDCTYSITDNERFFKGVLKNSTKRKALKGERTSAKKSRVSKKNVIKRSKIVETQNTDLAKEGVSKEQCSEEMKQRDNRQQGNDENVTEDIDEELC